MALSFYQVPETVPDGGHDDDDGDNDAKDDRESSQNELNQLKKVPSTEQMEQNLHRGGGDVSHRGDMSQRGGGETTTEDENSDKESLKEEKENQVKISILVSCYIPSYLIIPHRI